MLINLVKTKKLLLVFLIICAAIPRLYNLEKQNLWLDEAYSVMMSKDLANIWFEQIKDSSPPLYYTILHFWISFFGDTEFSIRLLSAIFGILLVLLIFVVGTNIFGEKAGFFAALFVAISPYHIYYSQEARAYSLLALLSLASFSMLYLSIKKNKSIYWMAYVLITISCLYTHNYGILLLLAEIFFCIFSINNVRVLKSIIVSQIFIFIVFLPRILVLSKQVMIDMNPWIAAPKIEDLILAFQYFCLLSWRLPMTPLLSLVYKIVLPVFVFIFIVGFLNKNKERLFLAAYFFIPLSFAFLISLKKPIYVAGRYDMLVFPAFCLIIGVGLSKINLSSVRYFLLTLVIIVTSVSLFHYYFIYKKSNDRTISEYVQKYSDKKDLIVATSLSIVPFEYYWKQEFQPRVFQFPVGPKSALVKEALDGKQEYITSEISKLLEKIYPMLNQRNKLWVLYERTVFSDALIKELETKFENISIVNFLKGDNLNQVCRIYIFIRR